MANFALCEFDFNFKKAPNKKRLLGNRLGEKEWVAETFIRHFTTYFITSVQLDIFFTVNTYMYHF